MKLTSYWLDTAPKFGRASQEPVEGKADVVSVGAGLTGTSAASQKERPRHGVRSRDGKDFNWPAIPGHFGPPWFLPFVGACYRLKDQLQ